MVGACLVGASTYLPLPVPRTRYERENAPDLRVKSFTLKQTDPGGVVVFEIGLANEGRGDVHNATINVLVPDFANSVRLLGGTGVWLTTPEPTIPGANGGSIYWTQTNMVFPGRNAVLLDVEVQLLPLRDFPVRVKLLSSDLREPIAAWTTGLGV